MLLLRGRLEQHFSSILRLRGRLEQHFSSILRLRARLEQHFSSILRFRGRLERPFRASCGSGAGSSGHFEPSVAPEQARAALFDSSHVSSILQLRARLEQHFSSILRLRGKLERPFRGSCGSGAGSSGHFEPSAAPGLVLTTVAVFRAAKSVTKAQVASKTS